MTLARFSWLLVIAVACSTASLFAAEGKAHRMLISGHGTKSIAIVAADGSIEWQCETDKCNDGHVLADGRVLFAHSDGAKIVDRDGKIRWSIEADDFEGGGEIQTVSPLPNGGILVGVNGTPTRIVELSAGGDVVKEIAFDSGVANAHGQFRVLRKTPEGTYLYGIMTTPKLFEMDADGKVIREFAVKKQAFHGARLANGHTLIGGGDGHEIVEYDADGKEVWRVDENDLADHPLHFVAMVQRLPNGNTVFANWQGHGVKTLGAQVVEITPEKKVVWSFMDYDRFNHISVVQVLDAEK